MNFPDMKAPTLLQFTVIANYVDHGQSISPVFPDRKMAEGWIARRIQDNRFIRDFVMVSSDSKVFIFNASGKLMVTV